MVLIVSLNAEPITPLPIDTEIDLVKAKLGEKLFFDPILSKDGTISCASCHDIFDGGDDASIVSRGIDNQKGGINSPTVLNSVFNFRQFWDGRAKDLQEQAAGPIENPLEMGNNFKNVIKTLKNSPYKKEFTSIYKDGVTKENITDVIAEFEKRLITLNSPFDNYLRGDKNAITKNEKEGYALFKSFGCIACHHGVNIGGNMYNKFGIIISVKDDNLGRYNVTKNESDKYFFKVPSLREVSKTAPYLHNGSMKTLKKVVYFMAKHQVGRAISDKQVDKIVSFLHSLSGELPEDIKKLKK
jgi:cytochrome c peroxidase